MGTVYAETLGWLEQQLKELDRWKHELILETDMDSAAQLERLQCHRDWLEKQLGDLSSEYVIPRN